MKDTGLWLMAKLVRISMNVMNYQEPVLRNVRIYLHISIHMSSYSLDKVQWVKVSFKNSLGFLLANYTNY